MTTVSPHRPAVVPSQPQAPPPPSTPPPPPPPPPAPPATGARRRRPPAMLTRSGRIRLGLAGIAVAYLLDSEIFIPVILLFVIVVPFEKLYPRKKGQRIRRPMVVTDITFALLSPVLNIVGLVAGVAIGALSLMWIPGLMVRPLVAALPPVLVPMAAFVMFDFLIYWTHRWAHEVPFLWRFHAVHHSPEHMDWISGFRAHPLDGVLIAPAFMFLLVAGFDVEVAGVLALVQIALGLFFHANVRLRLRRLDKLVCNPEFHHWHHANESDAIGHNYGGALPQWDLLFGTFFMPSDDRRPEHYGLDEPMPRTMLGLLTHPLRGLRSQVRKLRHPWRALRSVFAASRRLLGEVWATSRRPTHSVRRRSAAGSTSTNSSLFEPDDAPGVPPVRVF